MKYDIVVIGGGTGNKVASYASNKGFKTALIEPGPIGGTCLNRGCNPSKMLIHHADILNTVRDTNRFNIETTINDVKYKKITGEVKSTLNNIANQKEAEIREKNNLKLYKAKTKFIDNHELDIDGEKIKGDKIIIASGSRPIIPSDIDGLRDVDYLTSAEAMYLDYPPEHLIILGGGYIAAELGYFFETVGTEVTIIEMEENLLPQEDHEISETFTDIAEDRHNVLTGQKVKQISERRDDFVVITETETGDENRITGDEVLVALGRRPNTDTLNLQATDIKTNEHGFIKTNELLETTVENIWAIGDIADNSMFKHTADYEAKIVIRNSIEGKEEKANFEGTPHAIFTDPQIGSVGKKEQELEGKIEYKTGYSRFKDTAINRAQKFKHGFVKVLVGEKNGNILGCHILGREASILIHEIAIAIRNNLTAPDIKNSIHAHPTLSKVIEKAFDDLE